MKVMVVVMVRLLSEEDGGLPLHTPPLIYPLTSVKKFMNLWHF
jgi:hypothetical protein